MIISCGIAIIPPEGYPNQKNNSIKAVRWIQSVAYENGVEIKNALNGGEVKICGHYVDGYHETSKTIFEFYGCYWHGCPTHFPDRERKNHHNCLTMKQLYKETNEHKQLFEDSGYRVVEMWECDYDKNTKMMKNSETLWILNLPIWIHCNLEMPYLVEGQILPNSTTKSMSLPRMSSSILMSVSYTLSYASIDISY